MEEDEETTDKDFNTLLVEPIRLTPAQEAAELTRLLSGVATRTSLLVPGAIRGGEGDATSGDAATRSGRAHY